MAFSGPIALISSSVVIGVPIGMSFEVMPNWRYCL
jgi:hypothetical protein